MTSYDMPIQIIRNIFDESLLAVDPYKSASRHCAYVLSRYEKEKLNKLYLVSFGKAASLMARALADGVDNALTKGIVITKYGHTGEQHFADTLAVYEAGHPIPDENGLRATGEVLKLLKQADEGTLVVFLISGGGSALLCCPYEGISLAEKQAVTDLLLKAGANIQELNTVRKHISAVKGGRLAEIAYPAKMVSLILSDVIGDQLDVIASGPTSPDTSTYDDAMKVIQKYGLAARMPGNVIAFITSGAQGHIPETPKNGAPVFSWMNNIIIGSNAIAVEAAKKAAERSGYKTSVISTKLSGEASQVAKDLARAALDRKTTLRRGEKVCLIAGGETTVTVKGNGKGGRNTELALSFGIEIQGEPGITFLSAGTDGTDGPTDAAGAIVTGQMFSDAVKQGLDPQDYLTRNDSYTFFKATNGLVITGPTGTNVMDIQLILLEN
jgi:hydroxypyruvate reductase/glycerate 2-kinase